MVDDGWAGGWRARLGAVALGLALTAAPQLAGAEGWSERLPMDEGRAFFQAAAVGPMIYVGGGSGIVGPSSDFSSYDSRADFWRALQPLPAALEFFGMAALGGHIYVAGGVSEDEDTQSLEVSKRVWSFLPEERVWASLADLPAPRAEHALVAAGGTLWVVGGRGEGAETLLSYDFDSEEWQDAGALPELRRRAAVAVSGNLLLVTGGLDATNRPSRRVDIFDIETKRWRQGPALPIALSGHAAAVLGEGQLHVAGGATDDGRTISGTHYIYDFTADSWGEKGNLPTPRHGAASAVAAGNWYVMGGGAGSGALTLFTESDAVERYEP